MAREELILNGERIVTLKELLRPGLRAVFIGLNPAKKSVEFGHYYQGRHGRQFWNLLTEYGLVRASVRGMEDEAAFEQGYGFADLVRRPTERAPLLTEAEKSSAVRNLVARLTAIPGRPVIIFRYKEPWALAGKSLEQEGYRVLRMPSPYEKRERAKVMMADLVEAIS